MSHRIDETLLDIAAWRADLWQYAHEQEKRAFVPPQGDPAAGGGDPAAGGMPPGGDPAAMMGGDPAAMMGGGGAPPPPAGIDPGMIQQIVQATIQAQGGGGGGGMGAGSPTGPAGVGQKMKIDPTMVYLKLGRLEKLMLNMYEQMGWPLPPDTLNDDQMIQAAAGQAPAMGGGAPPPAPGGDPAAAAGPQAIPGIGQSPPIQPISPAGGGGGAEKTGALGLPQDDSGDSLLQAAAALEAIINAEFSND